MTDTYPHVPVLLERTVELLSPALDAPGAVLVDATLGMGGHSEAFLRRFPDLVVLGIDRDQDALKVAGERLAPFGSRVRLVHAVYDSVPGVLKDAGLDRAAGILFDLGVSSLQLDVAERGFAYSKDAPLDMRMDATSELTAERIVAEYSEADLKRIFYLYGEEKLAPRYARKIVQAREISPISRSGQLVDVLVAATPAAVQRAGHPAKRVFQALRIEVNDELGVLARAIPAAIGALALSGRMVVLAYQSLEDRIVKRAFAAAATSSAPRGLPVELPEHRPELRLLVRGAELAGDAEKSENPRSAPVRLRAVERIREAA
ncbi:MAG TPA: 16S rRNA (cytosine(1402)-N(4))-methyltransferase RsmH [Galbitalea sp.]|jgi:16S rRNA (cytosine1402-N4)-methyltransferase|nr:16S rRNA (cytosine(1402)-N(4))-methyltransferase RsmH [Galbitalea sp.]